MQTAAGLIGLIVKLTACVEGGKYHTFRRHALFMHLHRNAAAAVLHRAGTVRLQCDPDGIAETSQMLVHRIVHDLVDQVIESLCANAADIHARAFSHCFQTFQDCNAVCVILCICHVTPPSIKLFIKQMFELSLYLIKRKKIK